MNCPLDDRNEWRMTEPSEHARRAAEEIVFGPTLFYTHIGDSHKQAFVAAIIQSAIEAAETVFIDRLVTALESHGIDATNWDGDDPPHIIIANGIATGLKLKIDASTAELRKALAHYAHADYLTTEQQAKAFAAFHPEQKEKE